MSAVSIHYTAFLHHVPQSHIVHIDVNSLDVAVYQANFESLKRTRDMHTLLLFFRIITVNQLLLPIRKKY